MRISDWSSDLCSSDLVASAMDIGMQQDIVQNRAPAQQCGFLEHQAGKIGGPGNRIGTDPDRPGTGAGQTGNNLQQRRLAATARTKKRDELSRIDMQVQIGKRRYSPRSEEHTSELQSLMRISYAVFCLKKKKK